MSNFEKEYHKLLRNSSEGFRNQFFVSLRCLAAESGSIIMDIDLLKTNENIFAGYGHHGEVTNASNRIRI